MIYIFSQSLNLSFQSIFSLLVENLNKRHEETLRLMK